MLSRKFQLLGSIGSILPTRRYLTQHLICSLYSGLKKGWVFSKMFPQLLYKYASNKISNFLFITNIGYYCTIQTLYSYKFGEFSADPELLPELLRPSLGELAINLLETPFFSLKSPSFNYHIYFVPKPNLCWALDGQEETSHSFIIQCCFFQTQPSRLWRDWNSD